MSFRFATAVSQHPSLYQAIADVVIQTKAKLGGRLPDFCQLLITKAHSRNVDHAPKVWYQATASMPHWRCPQQQLQMRPCLCHAFAATHLMPVAVAWLVC
jgi:hypothetical protein